jgi:hypothetical protein
LQRVVGHLQVGPSVTQELNALELQVHSKSKAWRVLKGALMCGCH